MKVGPPPATEAQIAVETLALPAEFLGGGCVVPHASIPGGHLGARGGPSNGRVFMLPAHKS
eukprot:6259237-Amphidinium_carterae.1